MTEKKKVENPKNTVEKKEISNKQQPISDNSEKVRISGNINKIVNISGNLNKITQTVPKSSRRRIKPLYTISYIIILLLIISYLISKIF